MAPAAAANQQSHFALRYDGLIKVPQEGLYTFYLKSDDGSRLTVGGQKVVELNVLSDRDPWESKGSIALGKGLHRLGIDYFQNKVHSLLEIKYSVNGGPVKKVTADVLFHRQK